MTELSNVNKNHETSVPESIYDKQRREDRRQLSGTKRNLAKLQSLTSTYEPVTGEAEETHHKKREAKL